MVTASPPLLEMRGISKHYPGVTALDGVDLSLGRGEVLALMGENGAGKSTLIKVLAGAVRPDAGEILVNGERRAIASPLAARTAGVAVIHQEFNLVPALSAPENIFLGIERTQSGFVRSGDERRQAKRLLERIGVAVDPDTPCGRLTVAQQQAVEIAKALAVEARIIVMDEPTATLTPQEVDNLLAIVRELRQQGIGVIYISHRLEEVEAIADRVMVLRDGRHVATGLAATLDRSELIELMVGRPLESEFPRRTAVVGEPRLIVRGLGRGDRVRDISFEIRRGEVLALAGLVGAGRTEVARLIFGADRADAGSIELDGRRLTIRSPRDAIRAGICLLTEDRKHQGLVLSQSVVHNYSLPNLGGFSTAGWIDRRDERRSFLHAAESLRLRSSAADRPARTLSGGNQQKLVLAKWLESNAEVLLFDEPTRGIDVGAKFEIYTLMNEAASHGKAVLMISSELPEVLGMADRVIVMHGGRITGEIAHPRKASQADILSLAIR
jgi:ribose transport system ATP-binding protein